MLCQAPMHRWKQRAATLSHSLDFLQQVSTSHTLKSLKLHNMVVLTTILA